MMDASKYRVGYYPVGKEYNKWVEKTTLKNRPCGARWICATATKALSFP